MVKHQFGGEWTTEKLECVRNYLATYTTIFKRNEKAKYFSTTYVDAFAGSGQRVDSKSHAEAGADAENVLFPLADDDDAESLQKGSARIALEVRPPFDSYVFVEKRAKRVAELKAMVDLFPNSKCQVEQSEANVFLKSWCARTNWRRNRSVVFLDPYGMQVDWSTLEALADTEAVDLWLLFPLGVAVNRLVTRGELPPPAWQDRLTRIFGTEDWRSEFYETRVEQTLFEPESGHRRIVTLEGIGSYFLKRLRSIFPWVLNEPLIMENSRRMPIYLLCFASANPTKGDLAVGIAKSILK